MKVGRREFLKLVGASAAGAVIPAKPVEDVKDEEPVFEGLNQVINTGLVDRPEGEVIPLKWIPSTYSRDDCPVCRAAAQAEYDCDYYYPVSRGSQKHRWVDPLTKAIHHAIMEWDDHGLHTYFRVNGFHTGMVLSKDVPDPGAYLRSIWSCGLLAAAYMIAGPGEPWSTKT